MDPTITLITSALTTGATLMLQSALKEAAKDAYQGLKRRLQERGKPDLNDAVAKLEAKPDSASRQAVLAEELETAGAAQDDELLRLARALLEQTVSSGGAVKVSATNHSVAVGGSVGGPITITHREK